MDELDQRLVALDRAHSVTPELLDGLAVAAQREGRGSIRRRLAVIGLTVVLTFAGGVVAAPAAAQIVRDFLAQAQWFPLGGGEILPNSEWVDTSASDLRPYLETVYPEWLELAPGQTRQSVLDDVAANGAANTGLTQEVGLRRMIESRAYCGWAVALIDAHRAGDDSGYDEAAAVVLAAADWPALVATDGGGITDRLRDVGAAAVAGERGSWWKVYAAGECSLLGFDAQ